MGDPSIADALVVSPTEVIINGAARVDDARASGTRRRAQALFAGSDHRHAGSRALPPETLPGERITVSATGNSVTLSGQVRDASVGQPRGGDRQGHRRRR